MPTSAQIDTSRTAPTQDPVPRDHQRRAALARANAIRLARAALKRAVQAGQRCVVDVIADCPPEAASMTVTELLGAQHRWGEARTLRILRRAQLPETKPVGQLTPRQRRTLIECLEQASVGA